MPETPDEKLDAWINEATDYLQNQVGEGLKNLFGGLPKPSGNNGGNNGTPPPPEPQNNGGNNDGNNGGNNDGGNNEPPKKSNRWFGANHG